MIDDLVEAPLFRKYAPPAAGVIFIALFVSLALWQLDRAAEKKVLLELFDDDSPYAEVVDFGTLGQYARIQMDGQFLTDQQILIDNIIMNARQGYYVITPLRRNADRHLLLVNRGWVPKPGAASELPAIDVDRNTRTIRGLVGRLPRVGIRPGEAFAGPALWPRIGVYPDFDDIATELGETVLPVVLLLSPDEGDGFMRRWQPDTSGPMTHYGYAFQWFAMASAVLTLLLWHLLKGRRRDTKT